MNLKMIFQIIKRYVNYKLRLLKIIGYFKKPFEILIRINKQKLIPVKESNKKIINNLNLKGYSDLPINFFNKELLNAISKEILNRFDYKDLFENNNRRSSKKKKYFIQLLDDNDRNPDSIFVKFSLQKEITEIAGQYLGMIPSLSRIECIVSVGLNEEEFYGSQDWHKDWDDTKIFKLFVYLSSVKTQKDGPFTLISKSQSKKMNLSMLPFHKKTKELEKSGVNYDTIEIFGDPLKSFIVDTHACYHRGSRLAKGNYRIALVITYNTPSRLHPIKSSFNYSENLNQVQNLILK